MGQRVLFRAWKVISLESVWTRRQKKHTVMKQKGHSQIGMGGRKAVLNPRRGEKQVPKVKKTIPGAAVGRRGENKQRRPLKKHSHILLKNQEPSVTNIRRSQTASNFFKKQETLKIPWEFQTESGRVILYHPSEGSGRFGIKKKKKK